MSSLSARLKESFLSLRYRDFRLLWTGQLISQAGSQMQIVAINWQVYLITHSALALGFVGLVRVVPIIVFSLVGGVMADAVDRRKLMIVTQIVMLAAALGLGILSITGLQIVWPIYLLTAISSACVAFDNPARQALVPRLVPREHLPNALSLNLMMFHIATIVGPTVAGFVIAASGVDAVYLMNAASFLAVVGALFVMNKSYGKMESSGTVSFGALKEGLRFVLRTPIMRSTMLLDFFATLFASATALLPIYAKDILGVGAQGLGLLYAAPSVGAVVAGLIVSATTSRIERHGRVLIWSVVWFGAATIAFGISRSFPLTLLMLAVTGAADTVSTVLRSTIRQLATPDTLRGRMTSVSMIFFMGGPQLGEMEAGMVAAMFGATASVVSGGIGCVLVALVIGVFVPVLRRYRL